MSTGPGQACGIKDIATALGVSIGTVDRALHGRPGINSMTRAKVLKMAQTLGYQPNFAARHLKLNRKLQISVHLPKEIASFFDVLRAGIVEAAAPFRSTIELRFRSYPHLGEQDVELFEEALAEKSSGIIVVPGHPADLRPWIRRAARANIPVVCVASDAPGTERLCSVCSDATASGGIAAELLTRFVNKPGGVIIATGDLNATDHAAKVAAFSKCLSVMHSPLKLLATLEMHDDPKLAFRMTQDALAKQERTKQRLRAVYVSTANSLGVIKAIGEANLKSDVTVITTDLFPALVPLIRDGSVAATIYQRPKAQGRLAFRSLYRFLVEGFVQRRNSVCRRTLYCRATWIAFSKCWQSRKRKYDTMSGGNVHEGCPTGFLGRVDHGRREPDTADFLTSEFRSHPATGSSAFRRTWGA